jgi:hypothetical protein
MDGRLLAMQRRAESAILTGQPARTNCQQDIRSRGTLPD